MLRNGATICPSTKAGDSTSTNPDSSAPPRGILLVDRNSITRLGLREVFRHHQNFQVVAEAGTAHEAVSLISLVQPHLVILDTCLPDADGLELARDLVQQKRRVLIFSHQNSTEDLLRAYAARVHGFVAKSSPQHDLLQAVHMLEAGRAFFPPGLQHQARERACQVRLSSREIEVLRLIYEGLSNKEMATRLNVSECTAKTFLARTMKKLEVHDRTSAVLTALKRGWITPH